jgi:hypothetical protein
MGDKTICDDLLTALEGLMGNLLPPDPISSMQALRACDSGYRQNYKKAQDVIARANGEQRDS